MRPPPRTLDRRRFLVLSGTAALVASGCGRLAEAPPDQPQAAVRDRTVDAARPAPDARSGSEAERRGHGDGGGDGRPPASDAEEGDGSEAAHDAHEAATDPDASQRAGDPTDTADAVDPGLEDRVPREWGEQVTGIRTRIDTDERVLALTFDGCGGPGGSSVDTALLDHLDDLAVPATLFLNARWIAANRSLTRELARDPRYELANHGTEHRPLSVTGQQAYGIRGTRSVQEVVEEVVTCQRLLGDLTGEAPRHFRPGTAYADEVAVEVVDQLGLEVVNFDVLGDAGATFSSAEVERALLGAQPGSIALLHMNHPGSGTAAGVAAAVPQLRDRGFTFTTLGTQPLV